MVLCTREERRKQLWDELRRQRLLEQIEAQSHVHGEAPSELGPQPTGGQPNHWRDLDQIHDRLANQDATTAQNRAKWKAKDLDQVAVEDEELRADAEKKVERLGVRDRIIDPTQNLAAAMLVQKGEQKTRTRITGKAGTARGGSRGLLHPGSFIQDPIASSGKLGPSRTTVPRASGEHNVGSRVIA